MAKYKATMYIDDVETDEAYESDDLTMVLGWWKGAKERGEYFGDRLKVKITEDGQPYSGHQPGIMAKIMKAFVIGFIIGALLGICRCALEIHP